jgi:hypothetical protein
VVMDDRAVSWLAEQRVRWSGLLKAPLEEVDGSTVIHSFGGLGVHRAVLAALDLEGTPSGPSLSVEADPREVGLRARAALGGLESVINDEAARQLASLQVRHRDLLPPEVLVHEAHEFHVDGEGIERCLRVAAGEPWPS